MNSKLNRKVARALTATVVGGAAVFAVAAPASAAPADCTYNPGGRGGLGSYVDGLALDHRDWEIDLANAINTYRAQNGLAGLTYSRTLARPAMWASLDSYNRGSSPANHIDSRNMNIPQRVQFCSGYTGYVGEITYWGRGTGATWQSALAWWKSSPTHNNWMLDRRSKTFAVAMAYEGEDRRRAHYTVVFGDH
ncbi:hypothetical protein GCM10009609_74750 [Pseudonocardia aurantiaca]|uniref:CAP domain-containing protein n=1 Tax=Pseudonocardia aurantiaca TaxID=75290 RepID=A0ABW4FE09_9PSEU